MYYFNRLQSHVCFERCLHFRIMDESGTNFRNGTTSSALPLVTGLELNVFDGILDDAVDLVDPTNLTVAI